MIPAKEIAACCRDRRETGDHRNVLALWVSVSGNRKQLVVDFHDLVKGEPIVGLVVDGRYFENPNMMGNDFVCLLASKRAEIEPRLAMIAGPQGPLVFLLVARGELSTPQSASPVVLPEWLGPWGGIEVELQIEDVTWTAQVAIDNPLCRLGDIAELLYELECVLIARLAHTLKTDMNAANVLLQEARGRYGCDVAEFCVRARAGADGVKSRRSYRPAAVKVPSMTGYISQLAARTPPDGLAAAAKKLCVALSWESVRREPICHSLQAVLFRPSDFHTQSPDTMDAMNMVVVVRAASQLATAAHHAGEYPQFSYLLLRATSLDLRTNLDNFVRRLDIRDMG